MSYKVDIQVSQTAEKLSQELQTTVTSRSISPVIGRAVVNHLKEHFYELNRERHRGFSTEGFYEAAARGTFMVDQGDEVSAVVNKLGIRLRLLGGTIKPVNSKYLTIPTEAAQGKRAGDIGNLKVLFGRQQTGQIGPIGLIADEGGAIRRTGGRAVRDKKTGQFREAGSRIRVPVDQRDRFGRFQKQFTASGARRTQSSEGKVFFWLKLFVIQQPDPSVVPSLDELEQVGYDAAVKFLTRPR